jgi:exopolysaccharide biosynthesis protein
MIHFLNSRFVLLLLLFVVLLLSISVIYLLVSNSTKIMSLNKTIDSLDKQVAVLSHTADNLRKEKDALSTSGIRTRLNTYNKTVEKYETVKAKAASYKSKGINVKTVEKELTKVVDLIFGRKYPKADKRLTQLDNGLEKLFKDWEAARAAAAAKAQPKSCGIPTSGYCQLSIKTGNGTFTTDIVAIDLNQATVITDTANSSNCSNNCPIKSLLSYVQKRSAFAGINGTYFCPSDYASCAGKINSYDFPVYNSNLKKWLNADKLFWSDRAMLAFTSSGAVFYPQANAYTSLPGIRAGLVNHPGLVYNGKNIVNKYNLTSAQLTKGYRGGIGVKSNTVYLVIVQSATVRDIAAVMMAVGAKHALNLDGGGSSALIYKGSYKFGPGRSLPNAILFR